MTRKRADAWDLVLVMVPGWVLLLGLLCSLLVPGDSAWATAPFGAGIAMSFVLIGAGERRRRGWEQAETESSNWVAKIGDQMGTNQEIIRRCSRDLDLNPKTVLAVAWTPWLLLLGFLTFLVLNAVVDFIPS